MTFEVELKFRLTDPAAIQTRLRKLNAVAEPVETQADEYLAHPCRDFAATDEALRIRTIGEQSCITYKGPVLDRTTKTRSEIELPLGSAVDGRRFRELLERLGFCPVMTVTKVRQPFRLDWQGRTFHLGLDDVPSLGWFLELELLAEDDELPAAQAAVRELGTMLGLDAAEEKTYLELVLAARLEGKIRDEIAN